MQKRQQDLELVEMGEEWLQGHQEGQVQSWWVGG
jgi:hypothetical protein